ncbi:SDR family NAD(P)-dependent oxidoreductase [Mycolicibacterium septicum]|uniref:SDR family NAD(P)-dependent oxidoreductase n=1 Tax=Mycolicibacterium septicum TaxID=98668 RepID=UPI0023623B24|nr:glucose 1-dehydrogenase [Mycolicibacterium septicum]
MRLKDQVAIVTGAARNIGREFALGLAKEGASVLVADIRDPESVVAEITDAGGQAAGFVGDLSDEGTVNAMVAAAVKTFGRVNVLVNNAALYGDLQGSGPLENLDAAVWDATMAVNIRGPFLCTKAVFPVMRENGGGSIINISSGTIWVGAPGLGHYVVSKSAVVGLTRVAASEGGPHQIRVNAITPGFILTQASRDVAASMGMDETVIANMSAAMTPLGRMEQPEDLVGAVVFLASPESAFITGQTLNVDGGAIKH